MPSKAFRLNMYVSIPAFVGAAFMVGLARAQTIFDLAETGWTVNNYAMNISVPGGVPSQVHLDLFEGRVIGDPYFGINDHNLQWVAESNWTYTSGAIQGL
jgi:beta-mannosidase